MIFTIGETAGEIWKLLKEEGPLSISTIQKKVNKSGNIVLMGIGWLAKEDKLLFTPKNRSTLINLKEVIQL